MMTDNVKNRRKPKEVSDSFDIIEKIYGILPERPLHLDVKTVWEDSGFAAGKAIMKGQNLILDLGESEITLPFISVVPKGANNLPAIISLNYDSAVPNKYLPAEEIIDRGYAIYSLDIESISRMDVDFKSGISAKISRSRRKKTAAGKTSVWAWAAMRLAEQVYDLEATDKSALIIAGHGLLARSAMLAAGYNESVSFVIANGLSAYPAPFSKSNPKSGLTVCDFTYLYSPAFAEDPSIDEIDALMEHCKDKTVLLGSSEESEPLFCGLCPIKSNIPTAAVGIQKENISYHVRPGSEYLSREDWNIYLDFIDKKRK